MSLLSPGADDLAVLGAAFLWLGRDRLREAAGIWSTAGEETPLLEEPV
jgi:hypothetical protein